MTSSTKAGSRTARHIPLQTDDRKYGYSLTMEKIQSANLPVVYLPSLKVTTISSVLPSMDLLDAHLETLGMTVFF